MKILKNMIILCIGIVLSSMPLSSVASSQGKAPMHTNGMLHSIAEVATSSSSTFIQKYVEGEVLLVTNSIANLSTASTGMSVIAEHKGSTSFVRLKLPAGQTVQAAINTLAAQPWVAHVKSIYINQITAISNV